MEIGSIFANVPPNVTVGIVLALFLVMWIFKNYSRLYNNMKRISKSLRGVKYIQNPNAPTLSKEQYVALNICAILNEQNMYYCNCLETELTKMMLLPGLMKIMGLTTENLLLKLWHTFFIEVIIFIMMRLNP